MRISSFFLLLMIFVLLPNQALSRFSAKTLVDADVKVKYFEQNTSALLPDTVENDGQVLFSQGGYQVTVTVETCATATANDFRIIIDGGDDVNHISFHRTADIKECVELKTQQFNYEFVGDIDFELPLVQLTH